MDDGYEYEELPGPGRLPRWLVLLLVFALFVGVIFGGAWWWYERQLDPPGSPGETVSVEIPRGASTSGIGTILDQAGVIPNAMVFNFYASRKDAGPFLPGVYRLQRNSDVDLALEKLAEGPSEVDVSDEVVKISIPEGLTVPEILARTAEQHPELTVEDLQGALDEGTVVTSLRPDGEASYEGLLFPATYEVSSDASAADFLDQLAGEMQTRVQQRDPGEALARINQRYGLDLTAYDLLIVASLVQSEAGNVEEAPKIATVIYNRLADDMPLGIDAVDAYGAELAGVEVDYEDTSSPYNTRRNAGMPPTPISAPGDFALDAAFNPAEGPWLYYVLTEPRIHTFSVTLEEHNAATRICVQKGLGCG